jgi:hypothetical protein
MDVITVESKAFKELEAKINAIADYVLNKQEADNINEDEIWVDSYEVCTFLKISDKTLQRLQNRQSEYEDYLEWFKTLPLYYETNNFRAVHACWDNNNIEYLRKTLVDDRLTDDLIYQSVKKGTELNIAIDETLKGKEMKMPAGLSFTDKDGTVRTEIRIKWWEDPALMTYKSISVLPIDNLPQQPIRLSELKSSDYYTEHDKSVFFGHYWLKGKPFVYKEW